MASGRDKKDDKVKESTLLLSGKADEIYSLKAYLPNGLLIFSTFPEGTVNRIILNVYDPANKTIRGTILPPMVNFTFAEATCVPLAGNRFVYNFSGREGSLCATPSFGVFDTTNMTDIPANRSFPAHITKVPEVGTQVIGVPQNDQAIYLYDTEAQKIKRIKCNSRVVSYEPKERVFSVGFFQQNIIVVSVHAMPHRKTTISQWKMDEDLCTLEDRREFGFTASSADVLENHVALATNKRTVLYDLAEKKKENVDLDLPGAISAIKLLPGNVMALSVQNCLQMFNFQSKEQLGYFVLPGVCRSILLSDYGDIYCGLPHHGIIQIHQPLKSYFLELAEKISEGTALPRDVAQVVTSYLISERTKIIGAKSIEPPDDDETPDISGKPKLPR